MESAISLSIAVPWLCRTPILKCSINSMWHFKTYSRMSKPGFCKEEVMNTVHQCKSLWGLGILFINARSIDIHNLTLRSTSEARSSLYSTVFQSSKLLGCHPDSWGLFLRPDGLVRTIFRVLVAWCIVRTKIWVLDVGLISSGWIWGKFYDFVRSKRPKFWLFASGLCTYYQGSYSCKIKPLNFG